MGYGWMGGLGAAMQQVGSEQIPQYLARRRQDDQDKKAAEQQALANALAREQQDLEWTKQDELAGYHKDYLQMQGRQEDRLDKADFYEHDLPSLYGRSITELGQPQQDRLSRYGITPDASGRIAPSWGDRLKERQVNATIGAENAQAAAAAASRKASEEGRMWENVNRTANLLAGDSPINALTRLAAANPGTEMNPQAINLVTKEVAEQQVRTLQAYLRAAQMQGVPAKTIAEIQQALAEARQVAASGGGAGARKAPTDYFAPPPPKQPSKQ